MSRSATAIRLLVASLPFAQSLPRVLAPYQLPNATELLSPTGTGTVLSSTGVPEPAIIAPDFPFDEPLIDPLVDPIPIDPGLGDGPVPTDEPLPPIPLVTIPWDPIFSLPAPVESPVSDPPVVDVSPTPTPNTQTVTVQTFLSVVQQLLDVISQFLPNEDPLVRSISKRSTADVKLPGGSYSDSKLETFADLFSLLDSITTASMKSKFGTKVQKREASDALFEFYSALANGQEPVQDVGPFTATLRNTFEDLDESSQATLLELMTPESVHHDLSKRNSYPKQKSKPSYQEDGEDYGSDDDSGNKNFIRYFIKQFHYFAPTLFSLDPSTADGLAAIFTDPTIPVPMPRNLDLGSYPDQLKQFVIELYIFESIITDPSVPIDDKISILQSLLDGLYLGDPTPSTVEPEDSNTGAPLEGTVEPGAEPTDVVPDATPDPNTVVEDPNTVAEDPTTVTPDPAAESPVAEDPTTVTPDPTVVDTPVLAKRAMRRGRRALKARQHDEGTSLDDAEKLGDATLYELTGPKGTLDPLGQYDTGSYGGGNQPDPYATDDYDYGYPAEADYDLGYKQAVEDFKKQHGTDSYKADPYQADPYQADPYQADPYKPEPYKPEPYKPESYKPEPYTTSSTPNVYAHTPLSNSYKPEPPFEKYPSSKSELECKNSSPAPPPPPKHTTPQYVQDVVKDIYGTNEHHVGVYGNRYHDAEKLTPAEMSDANEADNYNERYWQL